MKKIISIKYTSFLSVAFLLFILFYSCGNKDEEPAPSAQDLTIDALSSSVFVYDAENSSTSAPGIDISDIAISLSQVNEDPIFSFTLSGGINQLVSGGVLEITDTGDVQITALSASSGTNLSVSPGSGTSFQNGILTLELETSVSSGRTNGLGSFMLFFKSES